MRELMAARSKILDFGSKLVIAQVQILSVTVPRSRGKDGCHSHRPNQGRYGYQVPRSRGKDGCHSHRPNQGRYGYQVYIAHLVFVFVTNTEHVRCLAVEGKTVAIHTDPTKVPRSRGKDGCHSHRPNQGRYGYQVNHPQTNTTPKKPTHNQPNHIYSASRVRVCDEYNEHGRCLAIEGKTVAIHTDPTKTQPRSVRLSGVYSASLVRVCDEYTEHGRCLAIEGKTVAIHTDPTKVPRSRGKDGCHSHRPNQGRYGYQVYIAHLVFAFVTNTEHVRCLAVEGKTVAIHTDPTKIGTAISRGKDGCHSHRPNQGRWLGRLRISGLVQNGSGLVGAKETLILPARRTRTKDLKGSVYASRSARREPWFRCKRELRTSSVVYCKISSYRVQLRSTCRGKSLSKSSKLQSVTLLILPRRGQYNTFASHGGFLSNSCKLQSVTLLILLRRGQYNTIASHGGFLSNSCELQSVTLLILLRRGQYNTIASHGGFLSNSCELQSVTLLILLRRGQYNTIASHGGFLSNSCELQSVTLLILLRRVTEDFCLSNSCKLQSVTLLILLRRGQYNTTASHGGFLFVEFLRGQYNTIASHRGFLSNSCKIQSVTLLILLRRVTEDFCLSNSCKLQSVTLILLSRGQYNTIASHGGFLSNSCKLQSVTLMIFLRRGQNNTIASHWNPVVIKHCVLFT
ncbi:hypothetical protein J6590_072019 [Homalodisca vitripennis]|nr:hypothetical protein J6590_072019 [Homalodisca vitripennis]